MAKPKKPKETQEEQSARFRAEVEHFVAAGELNPTEAVERFDHLVSRNLMNRKK